MTAAGLATGVDFLAYGAGHFGTVVASGNIDADPYGEILTGPGPGDVYGPLVRGFVRDGSAMAKISFYAYGTLRYGVNVRTGDVDADSFDELLSGAGPGAVFGPHVRLFDYDGVVISPTSNGSFFAYGTLKYGVNVASGDLDQDGFEEILTGPGPSPVFSPNVRGWNIDGVGVSTMGNVNFDAYGSAGYGVAVSAGDLDGDLAAEIACAPGPGPGSGARFVGFGIVGGQVASLPGFDVTPFPSSYGGWVATGDVALDATDELVCGAGRDPAQGSTVLSFGYEDQRVQLLHAGGTPFVPGQYGVTVAVGMTGY